MTPTPQALSNTAINQPLPSLDFKKEQPEIDKLISSWTEEQNRCTRRRELRQNRKSTAEEIQKETIPKDGTIIPDRTISSNIKRSSVPYKAYVTQSQRILIITDMTRPIVSIEPLELWFTRGMRYPNWKNPWFKLIDSFHVHGGCAMEVVYDTSKPLNVGLEYVPRSQLIFPLTTRDLQSCPRILRRYPVTSIQLQSFVTEFGFKESVVKDIMAKYNNQETFVDIYRVLSKVDGIVMNSWYCKDVPSDWLRDPQPHTIGLMDFDENMLKAPQVGPPGPDGQPTMVPMFLTPQWDQIREESAKPLPLTDYPLFWFSLQETEVDELLMEQGRVSMDLHVQEAMMRLLTNTVNASTRASGCYPCVESVPGEDPKLQELQPIKPDVIMSRALKFNTFPWPNNIILGVAQYLKVDKADESGQTDFAATARKDANKTAKELELATAQASLVTTSDMEVFSSPYLSLYALAYRVACHQAIFKLCIEPPNPALLLGDYNLSSAADVEVTKRAEDKENAKEFFNIVQGTPAAEKILKFLIQRFFPDQSDEWLAALDTPDYKSVIMQLLNVMQQVPTDELKPEEQLAFRSVIATAQSMVGAPPNGAPPKQIGPGQARSTQPGNASQPTAGY